MYKVIYVDEDQSDRHAFQRAYSEDFDVVVLNPCQDIDDSIKFILDEHCDGVVTDFKLNELANIHYTGTELVDKLLAIRDGFPIVILTGFPNGEGDPAINHVVDANIVYDKLDLKDVAKKELLKDKIYTNIKNYKSRIIKAADKIQELIKKDHMTPKEEAELLDLDSFLEKSIDKDSSIPDTIKTEFIQNKFDEIISLGKKIIKEHKNESGQ